jgi:DnaJ-domain-containing protein 1
MQNMGVGPLGGRLAGGPATPSPNEPWPTPAPVIPELPTPAPARGPRPDATAMEASLRRSLELVAPRTRTKDLFARLGVPRTAGRDEVKQAYLALAKQFHPDRFLAPALADLTTVVKELFAALNEAYEVLSDNKKRAEYLAATGAAGGAATAAAAGPSPELAEAAKIDFQKGEACVRTRDYGKARGFLEAAIRAHPRAEYQAALAWCILSDPQARDRPRVKELLEEAIKDPTCDRAFYLAGVVARDAKDEARAEKMFRAAYKANPGNVDAQREVRIIDARRKNKGEDRAFFKK